MPPPPSQPSGNTNSGAIAQDIILNILYYGSALSYPIGSAVEAVELICAMIYNVDLFGNEVDNVDKMIIALGILLPHVTKIPGVKQTLKAMISYLKKAGVPAKNALLRIFKKGKEATVKLFADAEKGASHGLNIFEDLGGDFLESAGEIVESIQRLGVKSREKIKSLLNISVEIVGNETGAIGDDVSNLLKTSGKNALAKGVKSTYGKKILNQLGERGWTKETIEEAMEKPHATFKTKDTRWSNDIGGRLNDDATAYVREDGHYVVRNDRTGNIVQVSDTNDPDWIKPF